MTGGIVHKIVWNSVFLGLFQFDTGTQPHSRDVEIFLDMPVILTDFKNLSVRTIKYAAEILIFCQSE